MKEHIVKAGDLLRPEGHRCSVGDVFIYCQLSHGEYTLISIYSGNRYTDNYITTQNIALSTLNDHTSEIWEFVGRFDLE
jgi:hypothetical protein